MQLNVRPRRALGARFVGYSALLLFAGGLVVGGMTVEILAAPGTADPHSSLPVRDNEKCKALLEEATRLCDELTALLATLKAPPEGGKTLSKLPPREFGTAYVTAQRLRRVANELVIQGEPAGVDFQVRGYALERQLETAMTDYRKQPGNEDRVGITYTIFVREAKRRSGILPKVNILVNARKWDAAEALMIPACDAVDEQGAWFQGQVREQTTGSLSKAMILVTQEMSKRRAEAARQELGARRAAEAPALSEIIAPFRSAVLQVRANGVADFEGQSLDGPQLLQAMADAWQRAQWQTLRTQGIDWARGLNAGESKSQELTGMLAQYKALSAEFPQVIGALIESDTERVAPGLARQLYLEYLAQLAPLVVSMAGEAFAKEIEPKLAALSAKSPELLAEVATYRIVTGELLRWRRRVAEAQARVQGKGYQSIVEAAIPAVSTGLNKPGLTGGASNQSLEFAIRFPLPLVAERMQKELVGKRIRLDRISGIEAAKRRAVSAYQRRMYATFSQPEAALAEVTALAGDLMVNKAAPPLTWEAALALASAQRGDYRAAGGKIKAATLEAVVTRFATLPESARPLVPLGQLPAESMAPAPLSQLLIRFDFQPNWVQNEYFFVALP